MVERAAESAPCDVCGEPVQDVWQAATLIGHKDCVTMVRYRQHLRVLTRQSPCECPQVSARLTDQGGRALWHDYLANYPDSSLTFSEAFTMARIVLEGAGVIPGRKVEPSPCSCPVDRCLAESIDDCYYSRLDDHEKIEASDPAPR